MNFDDNALFRQPKILDMREVNEDEAKEIEATAGGRMVAAKVNGKQELLGRLIRLQLRDGRLLTYRIAQVDVAYDWDIAQRPNKRQHRLVLQTSTGIGSAPKLLVAARLVDVGATDEQALDAFGRLSRDEGIIPALESAHAIAALERVVAEAEEGALVILCLSGRGDKDVYTLRDHIK